MTESMKGRILSNRYQITERIGIGGMAEVYRAQDNVLGRLVAVKVMLPQYAADPNFTKRFRQEAAAAANLQNPYIVNVYDWGQDDGTYYIVMEFVRGSDLKTAILQRGAINQRKVAEIGSQVCQALSVAHHQDIIHRDIKPQNIMVQPDGNVKVMDFGIARAKNSVMTQTSSVLGTAHYISPEQAQGKELTAASDIYSLGIVLYEAATGQLPFDGPDAVSVAMQQVNDLPMPPSSVKADIDPGLETIIMKAMAKRPCDRFATANDMRLALNDYLAGRPVNIGSSFDSAKTSVIGGPVAAGLAGAGIAAGAAGRASADSTQVMPAAAINSVNPAGSSNYRAGGTGANGKNFNSDEEAAAKKKRTIAIVASIIAALVIVGVIIFAVVSGNSGTGDPIPDVVGMTQDEAIKTLEDAGFEIGNINSAYDDKVESGKVISQDPAANQKREAKTKVNLVISQGQEQVTVPDLTNMTAEEAREALKKLELVPSAGSAEYSSEIEKDKVARQDPAAKSQVAKGSTVEYYLSAGKEGKEVPNVVGKSESDATALLKNAGFQVTTSSDYSDSVEAGKVISQTPEAKSSLEEGKTVNITVSQGKKEEPKATTYSVGVNYTQGGTVTSSASSVEAGGSVTVTITPSDGYTVKSATGIDSEVPDSGGTFTISNINSDVKISVEFEKASTTSNS